MTFVEIQQDVISRYRINICQDSKCWRRMHAHVKERKVCKWHPKAGAVATFDLLHEIGHIETHTSKMRRVESEYYATVWAIERAREYGIISKIPDRTRTLYQEYILNELDRGLRRGGSGYMTREQLTLEW